MSLTEIELLNQLEPLVASKVDFGQEGPTPNPYTLSSELRLSRLYSVSARDVNYEFWNLEWNVPYNNQNCMSDARQVMQLRHAANVSGYFLYLYRDRWNLGVMDENVRVVI